MKKIAVAVIEIQESRRCVDARFTWFQSPVRIEDALGRAFPWPAECSVEALCLELRVRLENSPGAEAVDDGEYELFYAHDIQHEIAASHSPRLLPGKTVNMSIVETININMTGECPMARCKSRLFTNSDGARLW